jgi:hypothetical protein
MNVLPYIAFRFVEKNIYLTFALLVLIILLIENRI